MSITRPTPEELVDLAEERFRNKPAVGDTYQPAFMIVDADGRITFDFQGRISADGVDLRIGDIILGKGITFQQDRSVLWKKTNGDARAGISAAASGSDEAAQWTLGDVFGGAGVQIGSRLLMGHVGGDMEIGVAHDVQTPLPGGDTHLYRQILGSDLAPWTSDYLLARGEHCFMFGSTVIGNGATAQIALTNIVFDITGVWDVPTQLYLTQRVGSVWTCRRAGIYLAFGYTTTGGAGGFGIQSNLRQNGVVQQNVGATGGTFPAWNIRSLVCNVGDTVDLTGVNATGAAQNFSSWLMMHRIGALTFNDV